MKITFLSRYQDKIQRGAENFVSEISERLSKNHEVNILESDGADDLPAVLAGKYDIVIPINGRFQSLKASLGRIIGKYNLLITGHSGIGRDDIWNLLVKPDVFVALTENQLRWAKKWSWGSKLVKIPNGIDLGRFTPLGKKLDLNLENPIILSVGALVWYKHHERAIKAVSKLSKGSLLIVGDGPLKTQLNQMGKSLLKNRFRIATFPYRDMPKVYRSVDLFTLPSWDREAFGLVYLEAMASGLGVVVPDDSARHEIIRDAGLFVDVADAQKYASTIEKALQTDWSKKARLQAKKFSWDKIAGQYEEVMQTLVKV
ncbi:hypothetical protein A3B45_00210 [Candidatus Daviesbacteria bacterium RIFCSPLOWO2_01_FULL_39_12]|uniref:Glycosyl transferase family 1 domain-containing protein n=1 Tax=Candidatus Daviesbacteria bacterium RIFCSPLOWO2_01_FULL_39_12 TaxID=1797785 RepID=A0A1F5KNU5_9BACT|nr:MAG: hypothetical protein A3B45_00210 [Candidatus Daviesbacteria bacterium RIFCSPLOWO2_01_FULL_39_12]